MKKLSNEELWKLFPIILEEYNVLWKERYESEKLVLENAIGKQNILEIYHFGSTSVPGLISKPTIDILIEIKHDTNLNNMILNLENSGYIYVEKPDSLPPYMVFNKGYTLDGFKGQAYHVHIRYKNIQKELYFRDYLLLHPETVQEYGKLKLKLQKQYKHNRDGYTNAKTDFITKITDIAIKESL